MPDILDSFPKGFTPRENPKVVLTKIQEAIQEGHRFIVVQCPTGTGKSHIAATLCNHSKKIDPRYQQLVETNKIFNKSYDTGEYEYEQEVMALPKWGASCLTITKHLQNQYAKIFNNSSTLKGKGNYTCDLDPSFSVDIAPCTASWKVGEQCLLQGICSYYNLLKKTLLTPFAVYNYSKFFSIPAFIRNRQFLICDEASELEDTLVQHFSAEIEYKLLDYYGIPHREKPYTEDLRKNMIWLTDIKINLDALITKMKDSSYTKSFSKREKEREVRKLRFCRNLRDKITLVIESSNKCAYVCQQDSEKCTFTPLYISSLSDELWGNHEQIILMSGTIFDVETFTKTLGIKKYKYIEVDSEFPSEKSPIYIPAKYTLNYGTMDAVLPKVIAQAQEIVSTFPEESGIIHTHTNKITNEFEKRTKNSKRYLFRKDHITNEHILAEHIAIGKPSVLVSPSMAFGVDLPDDLSRFQIVMKLPYPALGDKRIKALFDVDKKWYTMKMITKLIQMCGRSTRNAEDYSTTYILDGGAVSVLKREWSKLPLYFRNRLK